MLHYGVTERADNSGSDCDIFNPFMPMVPF